MSDVNQLQAMLDSINQRINTPLPGAPSVPYHVPTAPQPSPPTAPPITADAIRTAIQEAVAVEVKKYTDAHQQQQAQLQAQAAKAAQPTLQDAMMKEFLLTLRASIGAGLTGDQQLWLSSNILALNGYLKSPDGKALIQDLFNRFKAYVEQNPAT